MKLPIALGMVALCFAAQPLAAKPPLAPETVEVSAPDARTLPIRIWIPEEAPRGVALFSHGFNSWPAAYDALVDSLIGEGIAVVAPVHPDSLRSEVEGQIDPRSAFTARIANMAIASTFMQERFADLPVLAVGHSFGSLDAMVRAGGLPEVGAPIDSSVSAILAFSTPGRIPGLIGDDAFKGVELPTMLVTGDQDVVPGFVADPADHRIYAERVAGPSYLVSISNGDHNLVGEKAELESVWPAVTAFIATYLFDHQATPALAAHELGSKATERGGAE